MIVCDHNGSECIIFNQGRDCWCWMKIRDDNELNQLDNSSKFNSTINSNLTHEPNELN